MNHFHSSRQSDNRQPQPPRSSFSRALTAAVVAGIGLVAACGAIAEAARRAEIPSTTVLTLQKPRIVVVKSTRKLYLLDGETVVRVYSVTLGPEPTGQKIRAGDGRTPEGVFRICSKRSDSPNHRFLGIDYPDVRAAREGLDRGLISDGEAKAIFEAQRTGRCPSWTTDLGGAIGLHGAGARQTAGCIALADEHIEQLFAVLRIGDTVEVLP